MGWRGVSGVFFPTVTGKFLRQIGHDRITRHFCYDRSGGDGQAMRVAFYDRLGPPAQAECFVDYKAKQDNPLQLAYGVSQVSDEICGDIGAQEADLAARLAADGWTLLKVLSSFGPEGLDERKASAGEFFLRY